MILQIASNGSFFCDGRPITADRYAEIAAALAAKPNAPAGYAYHLTNDLTWAMEALPEAVEDDATVDDYEAALRELGVDV